MSPSEWADLLSEAAKAAKALNASSDEIQTAIEDFESKLREFAFGIEHWLESCPLTTSVDIDEDEQSGKRDEWQWCLELGYAKRGNDWALRLRNAQYLKRVTEYGDEWDFVCEQEVRPLQAASREHRIKAIERFPNFLGEVTDRARRAVQVIAAAKKAVAK